MYHNNFTDLSDIQLKNSYKMLIVIPETVSIKIEDNFIYVIGVLGKLSYKLNKFITIKLNNSKKNLVIYTKYYNNKALVGTFRSLINGMIKGVTLGFTKQLQLVGIGYRVSMQGDVLYFFVGLSHVVNYVLPSEVQAKCINQNEIILNSINKQLIGQVAADLRAIKPPDPFKGKGIRYLGELIYTKDTKKR